LIAAMAMASSAIAARISLEVPDAVPTGVSAADTTRLAAARIVLADDYSRTNALISRQAGECSQVVAGSADATACVVKAKAVRSAVTDYRYALSKFRDQIMIARMDAMTLELGWSAAERARVSSALSALEVDGDPYAATGVLRQTWREILARNNDAALAAEAGRGAGPALPDAGTQSSQDCTIFAMANASGEPYGVVAARATRLIENGTWRNAADRAHPQQAIERQGLTGGEVVMLAEALGQVEVVPSAGFASTLAKGSEIMIGVVPYDGNVSQGHEIVLSRTFQHDGTTWFEAIDSSQGPGQRLYMSNSELDTIAEAPGIVSRPEPGTVPKLLR
jgi:hypothetical protein